MILSALNCKHKNPIFWYICPEKLQARQNAWEYLRQFSQYIPNSELNEARLELSFDLGDGRGKAIIALKGANEGGTALRGAYLDGVVLDEMKDMPEDVWVSIIRPMLSDRLGWAVLTGTVGQGPWYQMYERESNNPSSEFKIFDFPVTTTGLISEAEQESMKRTMPANTWAREFLNDWQATEEGSYYSDILNSLEEDGKIANNAAIHYGNKPVFTAWDLGRSDATAIWFFQYDHQTKIFNVIDYLQISRQEMRNSNIKLKEGQSYDEMVFQKVMEKGYYYSTHILPHDSVHEHSSATNSTFEKYKRMAGHTKIYVAPKLKIQKGIETVQNILGQCVFNKIKCSKGLAALQSYRSKQSADGTETVPDHNWASHAADAFRYFAVSIPYLTRQTNLINNGQRFYDNINTKPKEIKSYDPFD